VYFNWSIEQKPYISSVKKLMFHCIHVNIY